MSKTKQTPDMMPEGGAVALKPRSGALGRIIRRFFLLLFTLVILILVGLVMGYVTVEYNILWAMVLHMINNLMLADFITRVLPGMPGNALVSLIIMACSLVAAVLLLVRLKDIREYCEKNPIRDRDAGNFFSAPGMVALELFVLYSVASPLVDQIVANMSQPIT